MSRYQERDASGKQLLSDLSLSSLDLSLHLIRQWVSSAFSGVDNHHGLAHAQEVEKYVIFICSHTDVDISKAEELVLRIAATVHDVGYAMYSLQWSPDRREHVKASLDFASGRLLTLPIFSDNPALLSIVCYLIARHDDINYQYPSLALKGKVQPVELGEYAIYLSEFEASLSREERERLLLLLNVLVVADGLTATGEAGAQRTFNYSSERGLPLIGRGNPLNAWCWEESALGNVRLAAKRAVLAAFSLESKRLAREEYSAMEHFVKILCAENNIPYCCETLTNLGDSDISNFVFQLVSYADWESLESAMRKVELLGDRSLLPYFSAPIAPRRCIISDLRPTSYYVLRSQIEQHRKLQTKLQSDYMLSLFDLIGMFQYKQNGDSFCISPPIVETYYEPTEGATVTAIVDGLHRLWLARELGLEEVWVIEVSNVPEKFPLVPLPLHWHDVRMVDSVPETSNKRRFRFPSIEDFPDISNLSQVPVTSKNYRYFFYRDLASLGSSGIRGGE